MVLTDLGTLGGNPSAAYGINSSGQVTGSSSLSGNTGSHAFRTGPNGRVSDPGTDLGGISSVGIGINGTGQVTGYANFAGTGPRAFRTTATGLVTDPGTNLGVFPGGTQSFGQGINDSGQV